MLSISFTTTMNILFINNQIYNTTLLACLVLHALTRWYDQGLQLQKIDNLQSQGVVMELMSFWILIAGSKII